MSFSTMVQSTNDIAQHGISMLIYGQSGAGKTTMISTLPKPIIISSEGRLITLRGYDIPFINVRSLEDLDKAYEIIATNNNYESVAIDSLTEVAEVILTNIKKEELGRNQGKANLLKVYGELSEKIFEIIRKFRDIGKNVYVTAWLDRIKDDMTGAMLYGPSIPGNRVTQALPYFFDLVAALRVEKGDNDHIYRCLMCNSDGQWQAKDGLGILSMWEAPDLGSIIERVKSSNIGVS